MACMSDDCWVYLPSLLSGSLLQNNTDDEPDSFDFLSSAYRSERAFPVYAMTPSPDPHPLLPSSVHDSGGADLFGTPSLKKLSWTILLFRQFDKHRNSCNQQQWRGLESNSHCAEKEPILSNFLYASVLSHDCLEQALAFVLAYRLQNPTLLATRVTDIFCDVMMHDKGIQRSIRLDVQACKDRRPACLSYCCALLYMKGYHALQVHRVAHALRGQGRQVLASDLQSRVSFRSRHTSCCKNGEGILLDHATGVVIGETAIVGNRVSLMHGVTLGGSGKEVGDRHPKIGDGALIGACATILGNIRIGEGAMIAAGSLVLKEVPPHCMVAGIPAKVVGHVHEHDPSLTMKHDATKAYFKHMAANFRDGKSTGAWDSDRNDVSST